MSNVIKNPQPKTIKTVINYLESIGLNVFGAAIDLETGERMGACQDYDAEDVIKYRKLYKKGLLD